jgi:hypothetical protein
MAAIETPRAVPSRSTPAAGGTTAPRWRHPFDSATGTVTLGVLLTVVLVVALRLLNE